jgi:G3E family GTPase
MSGAAPNPEGEGAGRTTSSVEPIALTVLTGFLGAGKTTLLQKLVREPGLEDTVVLINEVGEIALDHLFVEVLDESLLLLSSGCLCCAVRGDLLDSLERLAYLRERGGTPQFRRAIIETTGLADPAPLLHLVMTNPYLVQRYRLDGIVTIVDAINGSTTLDTHEEAVKQAAMADRLVLTKSDLAGRADAAERLAALRARLKRLNPAALVLDAAKGEATPAALLNAGLYDPAKKTPDVARWLAEEAVADAERRAGGGLDPKRHDERIRVFSLASEAAIPLSVLDGFLELLRATHGEKLLRLKGIVRLAEEPDQPVVLHAVQHVLHPPARLPAWPDEDRRSRLVCVTRDLEPSVVRRLFDAFLGVPAPDAPDRAALVDNPLALRPGA